MKEEKMTISMPVDELLKRIGRPALIDITSEGTITGVMLLSERSRQQSNNTNTAPEKS